MSWVAYLCLDETVWFVHVSRLGSNCLALLLFLELLELDRITRDGLDFLDLGDRTTTRRCLDVLLRQQLPSWF